MMMLVERNRNIVLTFEFDVFCRLRQNSKCRVKKKRRHFFLLKILNKGDLGQKREKSGNLQYPVVVLIHSFIH